MSPSGGSTDDGVTYTPTPLLAASYGSAQHTLRRPPQHTTYATGCNQWNIPCIVGVWLIVQTVEFLFTCLLGIVIRQ